MDVILNTRSQRFGPLKLRGAKNVKFQRDFEQLLTLIGNISATEHGIEKMENGIANYALSVVRQCLQR